MNQPDPNNELRHLIRSAKEEVAALDARFDRLEQAVVDQRTDLDQVRVTLGQHTDALGEIREQQRLHTAALEQILRRLPEPRTGS